MKELLLYERMAQLLHGVLFLNKEISHSLLPSRPTRLFMFLRNWNLLCLWVGQCYCQGFIGFFQIFWPSPRVVFVFFRKKSPSAAPQVALLLVESAREWSPGGFLGDEVLSYLHNMLLPETVGSNRNPLLAMSWFWWWLLAGASQVVPATFCGQVLEDALWGLRFALATARCHHSVARGTSAGGKGKFPNRCWATT